MRKAQSWGILDDKHEEKEMEGQALKQDTLAAGDLMGRMNLTDLLSIYEVTI